MSIVGGQHPTGSAGAPSADSPVSFDRRPLRVPREDRGLLIDPDDLPVAELVRANREERTSWDYDVQGRDLQELVVEARHLLVASALDYTGQYRDVPPVNGPPESILLAGHQPQLFHPGVWLKNFALSQFAEETGSLAVNLIIDSDTVRQNTLPVPTGSLDEPRRVAIPFDRVSEPIPFEDRGVFDRDRFRAFGHKVEETIRPLVSRPLIRSLWPLAVERLDATENLGRALAQSRHMIEGKWGAATLEVPQSLVCDAEPHRWFVAHLLAHLPRFREVYNEAVGAYRRAHRIRNQAHPVPDLAERDGWLEAPFWIWTAENPRRRALYACLRHEGIRLTDFGDVTIDLPLAEDASAERAVEVLQDASQRGIRIRSRALMTTLWARLVLGDLFLHGIGGGKYDQLTDVLMTRFFGVTPPRFMILSGTLHLPHDAADVTEEDARRIEHELRGHTFHPECYLDEHGPTNGQDRQTMRELVARKQRWIATEPTPDNVAQRHAEIGFVNRQLQPYVAASRRAREKRLEDVRRSLRAESVLAWRDYGFCLHPEENLREFLTEALQMFQNTL